MVSVYNNAIYYNSLLFLLQQPPASTTTTSSSTTTVSVYYNGLLLLLLHFALLIQEPPAATKAKDSRSVELGRGGGKTRGRATYRDEVLRAVPQVRCPKQGPESSPQDGTLRDPVPTNGGVPFHSTPDALPGDWHESLGLLCMTHPLVTTRSRV